MSTLFICHDTPTVCNKQTTVGDRFFSVILPEQVVVFADGEG